MSKNKQNFALDVSALSTYSDQITGLAKEMILAANTIKGNLVTIKYGAVGDQHQLNLVKSTMYGTTAACSTFADSGSTVLSKSIVQLCPIKFEQSICLETLSRYYYDYYMSREFNNESLGSFESTFVANKLEATALELDKVLWRGANDSNPYAANLTGNLALCSGFLQVAYDNSASTINVAKTAITSSNAYQIVDALVSNVATNAPVLLDAPDTCLFLSPADFQSYVQSLRSLNLFHYDGSQVSNGISEILHPGAINLKVVKVNGMNGAASGTALITFKENINAVISAESDLNFDMWFDKYLDALALRAKIKMGVGFIQPELVIRIA